LEKPFSAACERNQEDIARRLQRVFKNTRCVLEIGSGSGQHAVCFAPRLPWLEWHTSDLTHCHSGIMQWLKAVPNANLHPPIALDVCNPWPQIGHDAIFTANTVHIMPWRAVRHLFLGATETLPSRGLLCLYGPFIYTRKSLAASNKRFDEQLKQRDPTQGLRYVEALDRLAKRSGLELVADMTMPTNNQLLVWQKYC
tara:strand:- start:6662 stop:7255 length:594 start_codon:yes stop_codon:yes gene_type:complete